MLKKFVIKVLDVAFHDDQSIEYSIADQMQMGKENYLGKLVSSSDVSLGCWLYSYILYSLRLHTCASKSGVG